MKITRTLLVQIIGTLVNTSYYISQFCKNVIQAFLKTIMLCKIMSENPNFLWEN